MQGQDTGLNSDFLDIKLHFVCKNVTILECKFK